VIDTRWTLFDGRAGEGTAQVWLERMANGGARLRTQEWGAGVERAFGAERIETWLTIGPQALFTLAFALVMDRPELPPADPPMDTLAAAYRADDAASEHARRRLEELGLPYEFSLR
jgi:hypothetical protein